MSGRLAGALRESERVRLLIAKSAAQLSAADSAAKQQALAAGLRQAADDLLAVNRSLEAEVAAPTYRT